jgi:hypothetical protein
MTRDELYQKLEAAVRADDVDALVSLDSEVQSDAYRRTVASECKRAVSGLRDKKAASLIIALSAELMVLRDRTAVLLSIQALRRRLLERRTEALEAAQREQKFCGVWQRALPYKRGNFTTFDGSLWVALRDTSGSKPGEHPEDWQLCVKR